MHWTHPFGSNIPVCLSHTASRCCCPCTCHSQPGSLPASMCSPLNSAVNPLPGFGLQQCSRWQEHDGRQHRAYITTSSLTERRHTGTEAFQAIDGCLWVELRQQCLIYHTPNLENPTLDSGSWQGSQAIRPTSPVGDRGLSSITHRADHAACGTAVAAWHVPRRPLTWRHTALRPPPSVAAAGSGPPAAGRRVRCLAPTCLRSRVRCPR